MSKMLIAAMCLCGLTWTGSASAGFIGNDVQLQLEQTVAGNTSTYTSIVNVSSNPTNTSLYGIGITIDDSSLELTVPVSLSGDLTLTISDINHTIDPFKNPYVIGSGTVSSGDDFVKLSGFLPGVSTIGVSFGSSSTFSLLSLQSEPLFQGTVPEPMSLNLLILGLIILGMTVRQGRRARV